MQKVLITSKNITVYLKGDKVYVDKSMILSPHVKEYCRENGISLIYEEAKLYKKKESKEKESKEKEPNKSLKEKSIEILKKDFNIYDEELIQLILKKLEGEIRIWE